MKIKEIATELERLAPLSLQEDYDNAGLLVGSSEKECTGILISLDVTEAVVAEALRKNCNLIVSHHPIIFRGLKKLNGETLVERTVIAALKNDIALYAIHTNLDNVLEGVNSMIAGKLQLRSCRVLQPRKGTLQQLVTFVPPSHAGVVRDALFQAGAGAIGNYDECSFNSSGIGTFRAQEGSHPFVGEMGIRHTQDETRIEVVFPAPLQQLVLRALKKAHPYEEVAYYVYALENRQGIRGSGLVGDLEEPMTEGQLLGKLKESFHIPAIKHTSFTSQTVSTIAVCGGAGIFLLPDAIAAGAQVYITSDIKYHEFFEADGQLMLADIGHYESEQFTVELLTDYLQQKFPNFAVLKTEMNTNPVNYFI